MASIGISLPEPTKQVTPIKSKVTLIKACVGKKETDTSRPKPHSIKSKFRLSPRKSTRSVHDLLYEDSFQSSPSGKLVLRPRVSVTDLTKVPCLSIVGDESHVDWSVESLDTPYLNTPCPETTSCSWSPPLMKSSAEYIDQEMFLPESVCLPRF